VAVGAARVVDEQAAVRRGARVEGEPEQSPFPTGQDTAAKVEHNAPSTAHRVEHADPAGLLDDVQPTAAAPDVCEEDR
jgi:hypothetical protein